MFSNARPWSRNERARTEDRPSTSGDSRHSEATGNPARTQRPSKASSASRVVCQREAKPVVINCPEEVCCVAFLDDGGHVVSGGKDDRIRHWRVEDGKGALGTPMNAGSLVHRTAMSQDGKWIVGGTEGGMVQVWNAQTHKKETEFRGHPTHSFVWAVDVSPDGTKIVTGSSDKTASVWSLQAGQQLLGPWEHGQPVVAAKFSLDGGMIATATRNDSVRVYDALDGRLLLDVAIRVVASRNNCIAWKSDGKQLFALSRDCNICCVDVSTGKILSQWAIPDSNSGSIALAGNDTFIVASSRLSVSFWDTATHERVGSMIELTHNVCFLAISDNYDLVACGDNMIYLQNIRGMLPTRYAVEAKAPPEKAVQEVSRREQEESSDDKIACLEKVNQQLRDELASSQRAADKLMETNVLLRSREVRADSEITQLNKANLDLHSELAKYQRIADELNKTDVSLRSRETKANVEHTQLRESNEELRNALATSQRIANELKETNVLLRSQQTRAKVEIAQLKQEIQDLRNKLTSCQGTPYEQDERLDKSWRSQEMKAKDEIANLEQANQKLQTLYSDLRGRYLEKLVGLGDAARDANQHDDAIKFYSDALSLRPPNGSKILLRRSHELIVLDPSSHIGYEQRHAALHGLGRYTEAFDAFQLMLSTLEQSPEPRMRELRRQYIDVTSVIQKEVEAVIRRLPTVLIDTDTGRLFDKAHQAAAFKELPVYDELRSSMTAELDHPRIQAEVKAFYRYVMFSHKWQPDEPTFQQVENTSVYALPLSPTFQKLRRFCELVVAIHYKWAWSDTCCVNQLDKGVQQESIVAMFKWYRRSSLTIVHLLGVLSESQEAGCLWRSIWNTRGWTYQEYVASRVVQFYTEDWKPYLGLQSFNHKELPAVLSEMEQATNVTTQQISTLQPGLGRAREKLYLASRRQTTRDEDMAYSLFGIFHVALPVIYGEGNEAVGRLLEHILMRSADVTLLAWTGYSGSHHSYLPVDLSVYDQIAPPHVPSPIELAEMNTMLMAVRTSLPDPSLAVVLYRRVYDLSPLSLVAGRLRLPCFVFPLADLVSLSAAESGLRVYRAVTPMLGDVEIKTTDDLHVAEGLLLVHPWISSLLDRDFSRGVAQFDLATRALRLVVCLRQSFGALLLAPLAREQYTRVATDSFITARVREETSLSDLTDGIRTVDIQ